MRSRVPLLDRITYYIVKRKGKQLRPMFVFLCSAIAGKINDRSYIAAAMVELLHTASLVHDDVVDDSMKRRGMFSINALWKNKIAVLVGDYLLSRGLLIALKNNEYEQLQILSEAVQNMSEGELLQIEKARRLDISEEVYFDIIRQKTASLIAAACKAGAAAAGATSENIERMRLFGEKIGIAFQIKDDLFDYGEDTIGKPTGIDIKEKKMTLPLIYTLNKVDGKTKRRIIKVVKHYGTDKEKVNEVIDIVAKSGGLAYAKEIMLKYRSEALQILEIFPENEYRESLETLVMYVTDRTK
ncbi:MAG: polyprenyl synthetase family protein [Saprospirales bacterium]|nr:MAG: polyprenyl synthetase family protein [Saprospirales bacterium]